MKMFIKNDLLGKLKKPMVELNLAINLKYKLANSSSFDFSWKPIVPRLQIYYKQTSPQICSINNLF